MSKKEEEVTIVLRRDGTIVMSWEGYPDRECFPAEEKARAAMAALGVEMKMTGLQDKTGGGDDEEGANHWQRQKA